MAPPHDAQRRLGRYLLLRSLAAGGMGEIFLAEHTGIAGFAKRVVLKQIRRELSRDPNYVRLFLNEARLGSFLNHPNIVHIFDVGHEGDNLWLVMEYVDGVDLKRLMRRARLAGRPISPQVLAAIVVQVLSALQEAHSGGPLLDAPIIHRDLSPENVLISRSVSIKVLDFGLARTPRRFDGRAEESGVHLRAMGEVFGTPATMSPEQIGGGAIDARSDLYSIGCVLYEMIAGRPPVQGSPAELLYQHVYVDPPPLRSIAPKEVPDAVCEMVHRCLEKDPDERPGDVTQVREAFDRRSRTRSRARAPVRITPAMPSQAAAKAKSSRVAWRVLTGAAVAGGALFGLVAAASPTPKTPLRPVEVQVPVVGAPAADPPSLHANLPVFEQARPKFVAEPRTPVAAPHRAPARKRLHKPKAARAEAPPPASTRPPSVTPTPRPRAASNDLSNPELKNPFSRE